MSKVALILWVVFSLNMVSFADHVYKVEKVGEDMYRISYADEMKDTKGKKVLIETKAVERTEVQLRDSHTKALNAKKQVDQLVKDLEFIFKKMKKLKD